MKPIDFLIMILSLFVGVMCFGGVIVAVVNWKIIVDLLKAIFIDNANAWITAFVAASILSLVYLGRFNTYNNNR